MGLFTTRVSDAAYVLKWVAGTDAGDAHGTHIEPGMPRTAGRRIGVLSRQVGGAIDSAQQQALDQLAARLADAGAELVEVELPSEIPGGIAYALTLMAVEAAMIHGDLVDRTPGRVSQAMIALVEQGRSIPAPDYARIRAQQVQMAQRFNEWLTGTVALDALLVAPATGEAPRGLDYTGDASFCAPWTFLGVPAVTVPVGFGPSGLPLGVQLVGAVHGDQALLALADWVEQHTGWPAARAARLREMVRGRI
ncbi:amidase family protein [Paraburkholderia sp. WC7.3g]|uniref:amidase family protein n=1 Tax=Paraburkholderia sp. WC7.3g TaxID=2991070 RepID=UPI003D1C7647